MRKVAAVIGVVLASVVALAVPASASTTISAKVSSTTVQVGKTVYVTGTVSLASALDRVVLQRAVDHQWVDRGSAAVNPSTGTFKIAVTPSQAVTYTLRVTSPGHTIGSDRLSLRVTPPPSISARLSATSVRVGTTLYVTGTVKPASMSSRVVVQRLVGGSWSDRVAASVNRSTGAYRAAITPGQTGTYVLRVRSNGGGVVSPRLTLSVTAVPVVTPPPPSSNCNPNYTPCVPNASDVDCAGGSGNGPAYVVGPVRVIGVDVYGLDSDHDGIGCE